MEFKKISYNIKLQCANQGQPNEGEILDFIISLVIMFLFLSPICASVFPTAPTGSCFTRWRSGTWRPGGDGGGSPGFSGGFTIWRSVGTFGSTQKRHDGKTAWMDHERNHRKSQTILPREVRHQPADENRYQIYPSDLNKENLTVCSCSVFGYCLRHCLKFLHFTVSVTVYRFLKKKLLMIQHKPLNEK